MITGAAARKGRTEVREMLLARTRRAVEKLARDAPAGAVRDALTAPTDVGALGRLLNAVAAGDVATDASDPLAQAFIRGAEIKRELLERAGGGLPVGRVAKALGVSEAAVHQRRRRGALLAVDVGGTFLYPAAQFQPSGQPISGLPELLRGFPAEFDSWMILSALVEPTPALGGRSAFDVFGSGDDVERARVHALIRDLGR